MVTYLLMVCTVFLICAGPGGVLVAIVMWIFYGLSLRAQKIDQIKKENEMLKDYKDRKDTIQYMHLKENEEYLKRHGKT